MDNLDVFLEKISLAKLKGLPPVKRLSAQTNQPPTVIVGAFLALFLLISAFRSVGCFLTTLIAFVVPAIETLKTIENNGATEYERLVVYWLTFATLLFFKPVCAFLFGWIPLIHLFKFFFLMIVYLPNINGAQKLAEAARKLLERCQEPVDQFLGKLQSQAKIASDNLRRKKD